MSYDNSGYIDVAQRIAEFVEKYPDGCLQMDPPKMETIDGVLYLVGRAYAYRSPDDVRPGIGHAWEAVPGRTPYTKGSELMVLETSAWGRAIAALGIATRAGVATADEVHAAQARRGETPDPRHSGNRSVRAGALATAKQVGFLKRLMAAHNYSEVTLNDEVQARFGWELPRDGLEKLTATRASDVIDYLNSLPKDKPIIRSTPSAPDPDDPWASTPLVDPVTGEVAQ